MARCFDAFLAWCPTSRGSGRSTVRMDCYSLRECVVIGLPHMSRTDAPLSKKLGSGVSRRHCRMMKLSNHIGLRIYPSIALANGGAGIMTESGFRSSSSSRAASRGPSSIPLNPSAWPPSRPGPDPNLRRNTHRNLLDFARIGSALETAVTTWRVLHESGSLDIDAPKRLCCLRSPLSERRIQFSCGRVGR